MTPQEILQEAAKTLEKRGETYGRYEGSLNDIAAYWSVFLGQDITGRDVAAMMLLLKLARADASVKHADNYIDMVGYAALAGGLSGAAKD